MNLNVTKIVESALQTFLAALLIGAGAIIWRGATSVGDKIAESEARYQQLVKGIANELANVKVDITQLKTELSNAVYSAQMLEEDYPVIPPPAPVTSAPPNVPKVEPQTAPNEAFNPAQQMEQRAVKAELLDKFQYVPKK